MHTNTVHCIKQSADNYGICNLRFGTKLRFVQVEIKLKHVTKERRNKECTYIQCNVYRHVKIFLSCSLEFPVNLTQIPKVDTF